MTSPTNPPKTLPHPISQPQEPKKTIPGTDLCERSLAKMALDYLEDCSRRHIEQMESEETQAFTQVHKLHQLIARQAAENKKRSDRNEKEIEESKESRKRNTIEWEERLSFINLTNLIEKRNT